MTKKYKLHCFGCSYQFQNKEEVVRFGGDPYCGECAAGFYASDYDQFLEEQFHKENPNWTEQDDIDKANLAKYGEC